MLFFFQAKAVGSSINFLLWPYLLASGAEGQICSVCTDTRTHTWARILLLPYHAERRPLSLVARWYGADFADKWMIHLRSRKARKRMKLKVMKTKGETNSARIIIAQRGVSRFSFLLFTFSLLFVWWWESELKMKLCRHPSSANIVSRFLHPRSRIDRHWRSEGQTISCCLLLSSWNGIISAYVKVHLLPNNVLTTQHVRTETRNVVYSLHVCMDVFSPQVDKSLFALMPIFHTSNGARRIHLRGSRAIIQLGLNRPFRFDRGWNAQTYARRMHGKASIFPAVHLAACRPTLTHTYILNTHHKAGIPLLRRYVDVMLVDATQN